MTLTSETKMKDGAQPSSALQNPPFVPALQLGALLEGSCPASTKGYRQKSHRPSVKAHTARHQEPPTTCQRMTLLSLPPIHASTARERGNGTTTIVHTAASCTSSIRFAPPPRTTPSAKSNNEAHPARIRCHEPLSPPSEFINDLPGKQMETTRCFQMLQQWQQNAYGASLRVLLTEVYDVLHGAVYHQFIQEGTSDEVEDSSTTETLVQDNSENMEANQEPSEYFALVADAQKVLYQQQQVRKQLATQLEMENALQRDLSRQLTQLERELTQLHMRHAHSRAELEDERGAVQQLEEEYAALTAEEQDMKRECEVLELQLSTQRKLLEELLGQQRYLDYISSAPLKRHLEEKKWQEQCAAIEAQALEAETDNLKIEAELLQLDKQMVGLETQYESDVQAKQQAEINLSELQVTHERMKEDFDRARACHTPRPDWDRIVEETPELSVQKYQWELVEGASDHELDDLGDSEQTEERETAALAIPKLGDTIDTVAEQHTVELATAGGLGVGNTHRSQSKRRTKTLVKEMLHWIERLQKHCGVNLHLSRIWHDIEEARVELNILHQKLDRAARRNSTLSLTSSAVAGLSNMTLASPSKSKQVYITALGMHEDIPMFLRHRGKLKRRVLKKTEVESVVRKVWVEKRKREGRNPLGKFPLDQVLYEKLHRKYGFQPLIAEWGYNLLLALHSYSWDTEIEMFLLCLTGAVSDLVYVDQEKMLQGCQRLLLRLSQLYNIDSFVAERRVLLKDALVALRKFFPLKTSGQLQAIEQAIIRDMHKMKRGGNDSILYVEDILPLDAKYPLGFFVKTIRTQHFKEVQDYYALLISELEQRDSHDSGTLTVAAVKEAILMVDPLADPVALCTVLAKGLDLKARAHLDMCEVVDYRALLKTLNKACLMKFALNFDPNADISWRRQRGGDQPAVKSE